ncbi:hypothetical protein SDC9_38099 [bioreactor metagenome]|uniref:Uncharacterized protein n=1 Tax=bioreactor metagenome TaxID=1076179 RepID=A0A644VLG5_9ZZZZ
MRHDIIGVVIDPVERRLAQHHAGHAADGEQEQEPEGPEHRRLELDRAAPHRRDPAEHLHPCGHRDHHGGQHEVALLRQAEADGVHVVRPDDEAQDPDRHHRIDHRQIAEDRLAREGGDDVADDAEARQDDDVDLGVAEEPQDVLVKDRVTAACRVEEGGAEVAVHQQHGDGAGEHRQAEQDQPGGDEDRPGEKRHLVQRHARRTHVEEGGDDVDRAEDRACPRDMDGKDRQVHRIAAFRGRQRRIEHPAHPRAGLPAAARGEERGDAERDARDIKPVAEVVQPRESHVRRADVQRHEVVAEAAEQCRDHHEEHHQHAVIGDHHVPQMAVGRAGLARIGDQPRPFLAHVLHAGVHQLEPHVDREADRDQPDEGCGDQVENPDVLVIGGHEPAREEAAAVMRTAVKGCVRHVFPPCAAAGSPLPFVPHEGSLGCNSAPGNDFERGDAKKCRSCAGAGGAHAKARADRAARAGSRDCPGLTS